MLEIKTILMKKTENQMLVIFGASGVLTAPKLVPALFNLHVTGHLPKNFIVLGSSRSDMTDKDFRNKVVLDSKYLSNKTEKAQDVEDKIRFYYRIECQNLSVYI